MAVPSGSSSQFMADPAVLKMWKKAKQSNNKLVLGGVAQVAGVSVDALSSVRSSLAPSSANIDCATYPLPAGYEIYDVSVAPNSPPKECFFLNPGNGKVANTYVFRVPSAMTETSLAHQLIFGAFSKGVEEIGVLLRSLGVLGKNSSVSDALRFMKDENERECCIILASPTAIVVMGTLNTSASVGATTADVTWVDEIDSEVSADEDSERIYESP